MSPNTLAMILAIAAGFLLMMTGVSGVATWQMISDFVTNYVMDHIAIRAVFLVLLFVASLGGAAVIFGGIFIGKNRITTGKVLIALGAGMGIIGLLFSVTLAHLQGTLSIKIFLSIEMAGIILSIIARSIAVSGE